MEIPDRTAFLFEQVLSGAASQKQLMEIAARLQHYDMAELISSVTNLTASVEKLSKATWWVALITGLAALAAIATFITQLLKG